MTRSLAAVVMEAALTRVALAAMLALTTRMAATVAIRTVVVAAIARTSRPERSLTRVQPRRPKLTVVASTSARQLRALATALELVVETTLHSSQKLENPGQWSGFLFAFLLTHQPAN
jgi:hypothetical protein